MDVKLAKFQVNEWTHKLRKEGYQLDRQIRGIYYYFPYQNLCNTIEIL